MPMRLGRTCGASVMVWPCTTSLPKSAVLLRNLSRIHIKSVPVCFADAHARAHARMNEDIAALFVRQLHATDEVEMIARNPVSEFVLGAVEVLFRRRKPGW